MAASLARRSTAEPAERIISLLWLLLHEPRGYTREQIRRLVVGYEDLGEGAFAKLFQRDRRVLRAVGVPLLRAARADDGGEDAEEGSRYRVDREALLLRDLDLTVDERRALVRARRLWADSPLRADVVRAVGLLFHPADLADDDALAGYHTVMPRSDPRLEVLTEAAAEQSTVRFAYRDAAGALRERTVRVWFLTLVRGRWYATGWDLDRGAERSFRLTRMETDPVLAEHAPEAPARPEGYDAAGLRVRLAGQADAERVRVWLAPGRGQAVRVAGRAVDPRADDGPPPAEGWELWEAAGGAREDGLGAEVAALLGEALFSPAHAGLVHRLAEDLEAAAAVHAPEPDPAWESLSLAPPVRRRARHSSEDLVGRLLDIVGLANRAGGVERAELLDRLGVTSRELDRDLALLAYCGMPEREFPGFQFDVEEEGGRIRVHQAAELAAPVRLTLPEAHTLVATLQTVADMTVLPAADREAARSAQRRIRERLIAAGEPLAEDPESAALLDAPTPGAAGPAAVVAHWDVAVDPETVRTLLDAIAEHRVLRLRYHAVRSDTQSERDVEPLAVVQDRTRLYLHAWCREAGDHRVFRVDRVSEIRETGERFRPRPRPAASHAPSDAGDEGLVAVVRWSHRVRDAADGYHPLAQAHLPGGDRVTRLALTGADVAAALVARHGGDVEVLAPAALRAEVAERAGRAARRARTGVA
ncbi:WYL domain-containing protein [Micrococcaceae bacterium Sec6.3]